MTSRLAFRDIFVPRDCILGEIGKGLRIALTVLDFGRTTFGASCTGAAMFCLARATRHANTRVQFGQTLGSFEMVKAKVVWSVKISTGYRSGLAFEDRWVKDIKKAVLQLMSTEG